MQDYRTRAYQKYASVFQSVAQNDDHIETIKRGRAYGYYFDQWLPLAENAAIVDLGCGSGSFLCFLQRRGYTNLAGVDVSAEQVQLARKFISTIVEGSALDFLAQHPAEYDLLVAFDLVEHLNKDEVLVFLDRCSAALKSGGRLIIQTPNGDSPLVGSVRYGDFTHEVCFTPRSLRYVLTLAGFQSIESREASPPSPYSRTTALRSVMWRVIRAAAKFVNFIETGSSGSGILTRVFLTSAIKP